MPTLSVLHSVGLESPVSEILVNLEAALLERQFQAQRSEGKERFTSRIGNDAYHGRFGIFPASEGARKRLFKKWVREVVANDLGHTKLGVPYDDYDPHPACCGH